MAKQRLPITDYFSHESPLATEFRRLFNHVQRQQEKSDLKSILITSAVTAEGKSTISACLSITAARKGYKTLLIDCDLRRPSLHRLFGVERENGMAEVIAEGLPVKSLIKKSELENLDIVSAGKATANPSELFDSRAIGAMVAELKFYYDYAFVDAPPVIPVSDPMLLAQELDGVILVIKAGSTPREVVERAVEIMKTNSTRVLGVVLNNAKGSLPYYYNYSHYHYDYSPHLPADGKRKKRSSTGAASSSEKQSQPNSTEHKRTTR
jgi:capsular exopolysaccharide synthesis family protein